MLALLLKDLRISPLRTFITGFSMLIGILAVIISVLVGTIGKEYLVATNEQLHGRTPTLSANISEADLNSEDKMGDFLHRVRDRLPNAALVFTPTEDFRFAPVRKLVAQDNSQALAEILGRAVSLETIFTTNGYNRVFVLPLVSGRWFSESMDAGLEVVLNKAGYEQYSYAKYLYASSFSSLNTSPLTVVGVVNDGRDDPVVYVNTPSFMRFSKWMWDANTARIYIYNNKGLSTDDVRTVINDALYDTISGQVDEVNQSSAPGAYASVADVLQIGFAVSAALLLFVSAVGIINIGLASLEQRSRELLVRRALGATKGSIIMLVIGGSLMLAVFVSIVAMGIGMFSVQIVSWYIPADAPISDPSFPISAALIAIGSSVITALAGSIIPAFRASMIEPALALR